MKYILKKDLPFAKEGTEVERIRSSSGTEELSFIKIGKYKCDFPDRVNMFEWIEEVKPREIIITYNQDNEVMSIRDERGNRHPIRNGCGCPTKESKYREVIE